MTNTYPHELSSHISLGPRPSCERGSGDFRVCLSCADSAYIISKPIRLLHWESNDISILFLRDIQLIWSGRFSEILSLDAKKREECTSYFEFG